MHEIYTELGRVRFLHRSKILTLCRGLRFHIKLAIDFDVRLYVIRLLFGGEFMEESCESIFIVL